MIAKAQLVDVQIEKEQQQDKDLGSLAKQMIEQAKTEAKRLQDGDKRKIASLEATQVQQK